MEHHYDEQHDRHYAQGRAEQAVNNQHPPRIRRFGGGEAVGPVWFLQSFLSSYGLPENYAANVARVEWYKLEFMLIMVFR
jgi:hypothetical protein